MSHIAFSLLSHVVVPLHTQHYPKQPASGKSSTYKVYKVNLLQSTKVRLNLVRDIRRELEQRWSPKEKRRLLRTQGALYMHWDDLSNYGRSTCLVTLIPEWHSPGGIINDTHIVYSRL